MEFKLPTETVTLPSQGLIYSSDNPLSSGKVEIKYMTAKEEDILTNANYINDACVCIPLISYFFGLLSSQSFPKAKKISCYLPENRCLRRQALTVNAGNGPLLMAPTIYPNSPSSSQCYYIDY